MIREEMRMVLEKRKKRKKRKKSKSKKRKGNEICAAGKAWAKELLIHIQVPMLTLLLQNTVKTQITLRVAKERVKAGRKENDKARTYRYNKRRTIYSS